MEICSGASKELTIENGINMIVDTWRVQRFEVIKYMKGPHERGLILRPNEELTQTLEDQMMNLSSMMSSRFVAPFLELTQKWEKLMSTISEARTAYSMRSSSASACAMLLPLVLRCVGHRGVVQGSEQMDVRKGCSQISDLATSPLASPTFLRYLEAIFIGSEDIRLQLPEEAKRFDRIQATFKKIMSETQKNPNVLDACTAEGRLTSLQVSARRLTLAHHVWCIIQIPSRLA